MTPNYEQYRYRYYQNKIDRYPDDKPMINENVHYYLSNALSLNDVNNNDNILVNYNYPNTSLDVDQKFDNMIAVGVSSSMGNISLSSYPFNNNNNNNTMINNSNFEWEYEDIYLDLNEKGLGISIRGGIDSATNHFGTTDIYVSRILNSGAVQQDGRIKLGDIIIHVNGTSLGNVTHKEAVDIILHAGPYLHLGIKRRKYINTSEIYEQINGDDEEEPLLINKPLIDNEIERINYLKTYDNCIKIELVKDINGFGLRLQGGVDNQIISGDSGIYVKDIIFNSPAHKCAQITPGDEIVAINDTNLENVPHEWALNIIRNSPALSIFTIRKQINWN